MNLDIKQMQYLVTLADVGNFTRAAKILYTSQPSLSTFVSKVETELGVTIFNRGKSPMILTSAGEVYIESLRAICRRAEETDQRMADIISNNMGVLKVGFPVERAASMLPYILPAFKKIYPNIDVQVKSASSQEMMQLVESRAISMGIVPLTNVTSQMKCEELCEEELLLVDGSGIIKKEHLAEGCSNCVDISKLKRIELISLKNTHAIRQFQDELFKENGITSKIIMEVPSNSAAYRLASTGMGATLVPELTIDLTQEVNVVRKYRISETGTYWKVMAVYGKDHHLSRIETDFMQCMKKELVKMKGQTVCEEIENQ